MNLKELAAAQALSYVTSDQVLGIGSGSTVNFFIRLLSDKLQHGEIHNIQVVPASNASAERMTQAGIPLTSLQDHPELDLAVDGADEIDLQLNLIKGMGCALLREKIVLTYARRVVIIADASKQVERLGRGPLPVEVLPFEAATHVNWLNSISTRAEIRRNIDGQPVVTDNGNLIAFCWFSDGISDPVSLAARLDAQPGIQGHGLFLGMANECLIAGSTGVHSLRKEVRDA